MHTIYSPLGGRVIEHCFSVDAKVSAGDALLLVESMKMEIPVEAEQDGTIVRYLVQVGEDVAEGDAVVELV